MNASFRLRLALASAALLVASSTALVSAATRAVDGPSVAPAITNAASWSAFAAGLNGAVTAVLVDGSQTYVAGMFTNAGGIAEADYLARWDGSQWHAMGSNGSGDGAFNATVGALAMYNGHLYAAGNFSNAAGVSAADFIARWTDDGWTAIGSNGAGNGALNAVVYTLEAFDGALYVGGEFTNAANYPASDYLAAWNDANWAAVAYYDINNPCLNGAVHALSASDTTLYVGGVFTDGCSNSANDYVGRISNHLLFPLGPSNVQGQLNGNVGDLAAYGTELYVVGNFENAAGIATADHVAHWDGSTWSALAAAGATDGPFKHWVDEVVVYNSDVYVGGDMMKVFGSAFDFIARWDGTTWQSVGSDSALSDYVRTLAVAGSRLIVGGFFTDAASISSADYVASFGPLPSITRKPDGRIAKGKGTLIGNNVYNATGVNQTRTATVSPGSSVTFKISIQNDGARKDRFRVQATGFLVTGYDVRFLVGTTDVTANVLGGQYVTPGIAPGGAVVLKAKVSVSSAAEAGSSIARLVTIRSMKDTAKLDAVKFTVSRP